MNQNTTESWDTLVLPEKFPVVQLQKIEQPAGAWQTFAAKPSTMLTCQGCGKGCITIAQRFKNRSELGNMYRKCKQQKHRWPCIQQQPQQPLTGPGSCFDFTFKGGWKSYFICCDWVGGKCVPDSRWVNGVNADHNREVCKGGW